LKIRSTPHQVRSSSNGIENGWAINLRLETEKSRYCILPPAPQAQIDLPDKCFPISYQRDIARWITRCIEESSIASLRVEHSLLQYLDVIRDLCVEGPMNDQAKQSSLGKFVKENVRDIFELWEAVKRELGDARTLFWMKLAELVRQGLVSKQSSNWEVALSSEDANELSRRNVGRLIISESGLESALSCHFLLQEYSGALEYGICWSGRLSEDREKRVLEAGKDVAAVRSELQKQDFKRHPWWVAVRRMNQNLDEKAVVLDLYSGDRFQRLVAEKLLDLFHQSAGRAHKINQTIRRNPI
jgi:hypothetical protein